MKYDVIKPNTQIHIHFEEGEDIEKTLLTIAQVAYDTAVPRGMGRTQKHLHAVGDEPDLTECIEYVGDDAVTDSLLGLKSRRLSLVGSVKSKRIPHKREPTCLKMNYINGRDCRTLITRTREGHWNFAAYAFQQRGVNREEFFKGEYKQLATDFLDDVIQRLQSR